MRPSLRVLLALTAAVVAGPTAGASGDATPEGALHAALTDLATAETARRPDEVASALARVGSAVEKDAALVGRALPRVREVLRRGEPGARAASIRVLARWRQPEPTRLWLSHLDPDEDDLVLEAAVAATADRADDAEVERALLAIAREASPGGAADARRALALEALGACRGPAARLLLSSPRAGATWLEESGRALGLGRTGTVEVVPSLLPLLDHADPAPRAHAWESLVRLTGRSFPAERAPWEAWWRERGTEVAPPVPAAPPAPDDRYQEPAPAHVPTYYGIKIAKPRSHVVFCLDVSQSMWGSGIDQARREVTRTLKSFPTTYAFDVVCFNENVTPWAGRLVRAHPVIKARLIAWLAERETVSYTNLFDAVETAFGYGGRGRRAVERPVRLDAVFLLSDGAPNRGRLRGHDEVVAGIADLSRRTIPVHTIGAGEEVFPLLRRIADATGGTFADAFEFD